MNEGRFSDPRSTGKDAEQILKRSFREFKERDREHCPTRLQTAIMGYSVAPFDVAPKTARRGRKPDWGPFFSESLAEATERGVGLDADTAGILPYVIESIAVRFGR